MNKNFAKEFYEILNVLPKNKELKDRIIKLIETRPIQGKVTEEPERQKIFRDILKDLINGEIPNLEAAYEKVQEEIPSESSKYKGNTRVFSSGWSERHVRTQISRFYNQAVMELLMEKGESECFIHHSSREDPSTRCSRLLAGTNQNIKQLYDRLIKNYEKGDWDNEVKIPDHPHCTHVISPL